MSDIWWASLYWMSGQTTFHYHRPFAFMLSTRRESWATSYSYFNITIGLADAVIDILLMLMLMGNGWCFSSCTKLEHHIKACDFLFEVLQCIMGFIQSVMLMRYGEWVTDSTSVMIFSVKWRKALYIVHKIQIDILVML